LDISISLIAGIIIGYWLDNYFKTFPWLTLIFFLAGIVAGVNTGIYMVKKFKKLTS